MTVEPLLFDSHAKLRAALYAAIIGEAVPEFQRLEAAITTRLQ